MGWFAIVALVGIPLAIWSHFASRKCPNCGEQMEREMQGFWSNAGTMSCACGYERDFVRRSRGSGSSRTYYEDVLEERFPTPPRRLTPRRRPQPARQVRQPSGPDAQGLDAIRPADEPKHGT